MLSAVSVSLVLVLPLLLLPPQISSTLLDSTKTNRTTGTRTPDEQNDPYASNTTLTLDETLSSTKHVNPAADTGDKTEKDFGSLEEEVLPTVFIALLVRNKAHTLPYFLTLLERLDYPKERIALW
jgi:hypothetical protein